MKLRPRRYFMAIIKDKNRGNFQSAVEIFKISLGKCWNALQIFWGEKGKGLSLSGRSPFCRLSQVIEKSRRVCVARINLVPDARELPGVEIAGNEGSLPATRRPSYPDDRPFPHAVQPLK